MRIDGTGRSQGVGQRGEARRKPGAGERFSVDLGGDTPRAAAAGPSEPLAEIDAILALQAVEDPLFARKKAVRRGQSILDTLEELKADLLAGLVSEGKLNRLVALVQQAKAGADPALEGLIAEIELRARVELAKLGRYPSF